MKKLTTYHTSPLEAEIDNKISTAYLFSVASIAQAAQVSQLFKERFITPSSETTQFPHHTKTQDENN